MNLTDFLASMDSDEMPDELVDVDELIHSQDNEGHAPAMPPESLEDFETAIRREERAPAPSENSVGTSRLSLRLESSACAPPTGD